MNHGMFTTYQLVLFRISLAHQFSEVPKRIFSDLAQIFEPPAFFVRSLCLWIFLLIRYVYVLLSLVNIIYEPGDRTLYHKC